MTRLSGAVLTTLCLLAASPFAMASCDFDDFPKMSEMLIGSIGDDVQWNHMPMAGRTFHVPASREQVMQFYERAWQGEVDHTHFDGWEQLLHINRRCMMMVQLKGLNSGFSYGRMLLTNPPSSSASARPLGSGMPVPSGAQVISDMRSDDDIRKGRLVLLLGDEDLHRTRAWYESELLRQGWRLEDRSDQGDAFVLNFAKGRELMSVGLVRVEDGRTQILLNRMDR